MKKLVVDPNVAFIIKKRPNALWSADQSGWYIIDNLEVLGHARKLSKAWKKAAEYLTKKKKGPKATRP